MRKRSAADPARQEDLQTHPVTTLVPDGQDRPRCFNAVWQGNRVCLLTRDGDVVSKRDVPAEYSAFIPAHQYEPKAREIERSSRVRGSKREGDYYRVRFRSYDDRRDVCAPERGVGTSVMGRAGLDVLEADLNPVKRWLADNDVEIQRPRRVYIDFEGDSRVPFAQKSRARILCWALVCHDTGRRILGMLEEDTDRAERELLEDLWFELQDFDQICAWSGGDYKEDGFGYDFPLLAARTKRHQIAIDPRRWLWVDQLEWFKTCNASSGESGDEKASNSLDNIAKRLLGEDEGKLEGVDGSMSWELWSAGGEDRKLLGRYCVRDTTRCHLIEKKTGFLDLLYVIAESCGTFPDNYGMRPVNYVESFLMRIGRRRNFHFPSNWRDKGSDKFEGAHVFEPTETGILRNVHVCDFSGMYPSIIQTWNMSLETHVPELRAVKGGGRPAYLAHVKESEAAAPLPPGHCRVPITGEVFRTEPRGMLVEAVDTVRENRKYYDKKKAACTPGTLDFIAAERGAQGAKIYVNGFYGVIGTPWSRLFRREIAESVTQAGVWMIKVVSSEATKRGMRFLYGDTDSGYIAGTTESEFRAFIVELNTIIFPRLLAEMGCTRNMIDIAYEKEFETLILLPSKKRYAGRYKHYKGKLATADSKPEIKGLEYKRGDTVRLCRDFQKRVIYSLLSGAEDVETYVEMVKAERAHILDDALDRADFVMAKKVSKPLDAYVVKKKLDGDDAAELIHVAVAKRMVALGMEVQEGTNIPYVVTDASDGLVAVPLCEYVEGTEDRFYLWENLVYPATMRVLQACFKAHDWKLYLRARPKAPRRAKPVPVEKSAFVFESGNPGFQIGDFKDAILVRPGENLAETVANARRAASPTHETTHPGHEKQGGRDSSGPAGRRDTADSTDPRDGSPGEHDGTGGRAAEAPQPFGSESARARRPRSSTSRAG